ncbi:MAG: primosomal protein N', partial [Bacteroidales bacterium]|nr:primosomal protein N' [Bacteroidales bacterium]
VLGTRSSLFLPHHNLGLIIVDEEHDNSYKQDSPAPYYNGRDTALMLSVIHSTAQNRCNILLGSATPSLEERYNCLTGRHILVELKERFHGSEDSEIEIIDTRAERRKNGMKGNFSRKLIDQIQRALNSGEQVMILRSRRAWAPVIQCENCGDMPKCPHCNVSLSLHKSEKGDFTACHHCGYKSAYSHNCSKCGGLYKTLGAGTQKIEEEAKILFPTAETARLDSDISQNKTRENQIIKDFSEGRIQILIGTQIVTKGFDFSNLTLVAVIAADTLLGMQDFRADEKAVQLLEQFRGRCGRREKKGRLIIQTSQPEHPVYQSIAQNTSTDFSDTLLTERKDFGFPPYSRIIELNIKDIFEDRAERMAVKLAQALSAKSLMITGPYSPAISKVADNHIRTIRICLRKDKNLPVHKKTLMDTLKAFEKENRYMGHISVNVDPA